MTYNVERRQSPRKRFHDLIYIEIESGNGGMLLNFSQHGVGFRAVKRVRPKQEVNFAFNLDEKRRIHGRGRLEWADQDGRVAGLQFTDVSEEIHAQIRTWLSASPQENAPAFVPANGSSGDHAAPTDSAPSQPTNGQMSSRRRAALAKLAAAKQDGPPSSASYSLAEADFQVSSGPVTQQITPDVPQSGTQEIPQEAARNATGSVEQDMPQNAPDNGAPAAPRDAAHAEGSRHKDSQEVPWAGVLPPAIGSERKTILMPQSPESHSNSADSGLRSSVETGEEFQLAQDLETESLSGSDPEAVGTTAAVEARVAETLNQQAQSLLQRFQQEEQRALEAFRESSTRIVRDADRRLFPIREAVHAHITSLESSVTSANATTKVLDKYPALLEKAQQQALDRFQAQLQEAMRIYVTELRRRSDAMLEEVNMQARASALMPKRISTSSGIIVTALIVLVLATLFVFRRETAGAFIWLGQQMVESAPASEPAASNSPTKGTDGKLAANTKPEANNMPEQASKPDTGPDTKSAAAPETRAKQEPPAATPSPAPSTTSSTPPNENPAPQAPTTSVRALWTEVAKGNISAELNLGNMYMTGHGVTKSCYQAHRLFAAAARKGNEEGKQRLAELERTGCFG